MNQKSLPHKIQDIHYALDALIERINALEGRVLALINQGDQWDEDTYRLDSACDDIDSMMVRIRRLEGQAR